MHIKTIIFLAACMALPHTAMSQKRSFLSRQTHYVGSYLQNNQIAKDKGIFRHIDVGITGSSAGIGFDLATPLGSWGQIRAGAIFRPHKTYTAQFHLNMGQDLGLNLTEEQFDSKFEQLAALMQTFTNTYPDETVQMKGQLLMHNYKFLIDLYPIKKHRNFHVTVGFYYGNSTLIEANTVPGNIKTQAAVNIFNDIYHKALGKESLIDVSGIATELGTTIEGATAFASAIERLRRWGSIKTTDAYGNTTEVTYTKEYIEGQPQYGTVENRTFEEKGVTVNLGKYTSDVTAPEDIYYDYSIELDNPYYVKDASQPSGYREERYARDANGTEIKKGNIRYHKGDVMYKAGDRVYLTPDEANQLTTIGEAKNKFKPYFGVGYTLPITKDKRTCLSVDAGILIWGGSPAVYIKQPIGVNANNEVVYHTLDLTKDITGAPTKVMDYVNTVKKYPVFPEIGIRLSHRLW